MRTRLVAEGVLSILVIFCCGCTVQTGAPTIAPTIDQSASIGEERQRVAQNCLDLWVNTIAAQTVVEYGENMTNYKGDPVEPVIVENQDGTLHVDVMSYYFEDWGASNNVPWERIKESILDGVGCPFEPSVQAELDQRTQECFDTWINAYAPQTTIDAGLAVTSPDGQLIAEPVVSLGPDDRYHVNLTSDNFTEWVAANHVPQEHITASTLYGQACPYGPSPGPMPTVTPS